MAGKKSTAARGPTALPKYRGTGFEEFYADPPMTAAEAKEERENIYHPTLPFVDRIQSCIQRFRSRRRIAGSEATQLFNQYLFLGGVDTFPRLFGGNVDQDMEGMTPDERRTATATDVVHSSGGGSRFYNADEPEGWDVDFAGVVAGFCSENLAASTNWDYLRMGKAIGIIENFLAYVLQHDVCPEYATNVKEALAICYRAKSDLPLTHRALMSFPGQFNLAMSELFCADFYHFDNDDKTSFKRPRDFNPVAVVKLAMAIGGLQMDLDLKKTTPLLDAICETRDNVCVSHEDDCSMEVVEIHRATQSARKFVQGVRFEGMGSGFSAMGKLVLKPCVIEDGYDHSVEEDGRCDGDRPQTFLVDDDVLGQLRLGFKMQLCVAHLNIGVSFIRQVRSVFVAWHTFLPQNLMLHFKEPVANDRPAPSVVNPNAEEYDESLEKSFGSA